MSDIKKTIQLNGKLYDAHTGQVIDAPQESTQAKTTKPNPSSKISKIKRAPGAVMDGFTRAGRKPEPSKTLMRPAVKKPKLSSNTEQPTRAEILRNTTPHSRTTRAKQTPKSSLVERFSRTGHTTGISRISQQLPVAKPSQDLAHKVSAVTHSAQQQVSQSAQLVEHAIASSSSHLMTFEKNLLENKSIWLRFGWKNKAVNISSVMASLALLVGFFAWQNITQIEMRVASTRAGVSAQLPSYSPAGFGVAGPIQTEPGKVTVSFKSRTDDRQFKISQQASNWNSDTLLNNYFLTSNRPAPISYPDEGKTIYIYDSASATWVDGGIWYNIEGNSNLTTDQLLRLANSL